MSNEENTILLESYFESFKATVKPDGTSFTDDQCSLFATLRLENDGEPLTEEQFFEIIKLDPNFPLAFKPLTNEEWKKKFHER
jgi:hypothetical protein